MRTATLLLAVVVVLVAAPAWADFEAGLEAYDRGDYATALKEWRPLAEQGDANAQFNMGILYSNGKGVPQDYAEAARWFRLAAEQGHAEAQVALGWMYALGQGVPQDYHEAVRWYNRAAEQGLAVAQSDLAVMYILGRGVPEDWVLAHMWANLAATQGDEEARKTRDILAEKMTPAQLADAQRMAREWKPEIAEERKNLSIDDVIAGFANNNLFYFEIILENGKYSKAFNKCLSSRPADFNWIKTNCKKNPELKNAFQCSEDSRFTHVWLIYESQDKCEEVREFTKDRLDALLR